MAATVRVRNLGPFDRDICPDRRDVLASVPVGGVIEVGAALGASLAEQADAWEIVPDGVKVIIGEPGPELDIKKAGVKA